MSTSKGAGRVSRRARQRCFAALVTLAALPLGACGGESDFTNEPARAAAPIVVTARIDQREVVVSPDHFGAGLVNFTIANFSDSPVTFTLSGPKDAASQQIPAGEPGGGAAATDLKVELPEGSYQASAGQGASAQPDTVKVGPKRQSSKNQLLLP
jgi:hypothetical protein